MQTIHRLAVLSVSVGLGLFMLAGCGPRHATLSGTVTWPDKMKLESNDIVNITLLPTDKDDKHAPVATFSRDDNTFVCKEIAPGTKYKITVRVESTFGTPDAQKRTAALADFNKNHDQTSTKLLYQATEESAQSIVVDLAKGTVTKK